jgi:tetratricopeptide (TPR) repeat protein
MSQTPDPHSAPRPRLWLWGSAAALFMIVILIGVFSQRYSGVISPTLPPPIPQGYSADDALIQAQEANMRADVALDSIDKILGIIQVMGVVVAIATAVIALAGYRTSRDLNEEMDNLHKLENDIESALDEVRDVRQLLSQVESAQQITERLRSEVGVNLEDLRGLRDELNANQRQLDEHISNVYKASGLSQLGQRHIVLGNLGAAAKVFQDVCDLDPTNPIYQYFLGDLHMRLGRVDEGIEHLRIARQDNYKYPSADASYAYALRLRGDQEKHAIQRERLYYESGEIFLGVYEVDPELVDISGESVFGALAGLFRRQGRYRDALKWYEHCRKVTPHNSYPVNNLAVLNFYRGNHEEARRYFKQAAVIAKEKLAARSSDYWARFDLITAKVATGETFEALADDLEHLEDVATNPLEKFLYGLQELRSATNPPEGVVGVIDQVIEKVKTIIASRENHIN